MIDFSRVSYNKFKKNYWQNINICYNGIVNDRGVDKRLYV